MHLEHVVSDHRVAVSARHGELVRVHNDAAVQRGCATNGQGALQVHCTCDDGGACDGSVAAVTMHLEHVVSDHRVAVSAGHSELVRVHNDAAVQRGCATNGQGGLQVHCTCDDGGACDGSV